MSCIISEILNVKWWHTLKILIIIYWRLLKNGTTLDRPLTVASRVKNSLSKDQCITFMCEETKQVSVNEIRNTVAIDWKPQWRVEELFSVRQQVVQFAVHCLNATDERITGRARLEFCQTTDRKRSYDKTWSGRG